MRARRGARTHARTGGAPGAPAAPATPLLAALLLALIPLLGACGGPARHGTGGAAGTTAAASPSTTAPVDPAGGKYVPPTRFGKPGVRLPPALGTAGDTGPTEAVGAAGAAGATGDRGGTSAALPIALHGSDAYVAGPEGMQVVDTRTGEVMATVHPQSPPPGDPADAGPVSAPLVTAVGGSTLSLALMPFLVGSAAQGSTPAGTAVELVAVDTSTRQTVWTALIGGLPAWASDGSTTGLGVDLVGVEGDVAVVQLSGAGVLGAAVGVDLKKHQAIWHQDDFEAEAVTGKAVVGRVPKNSSDASTAPGAPDASNTSNTESSIAALDLSDGEQLWKKLDADTVSIGPAAPGRVLVTGTDHGDAKGFSYLVDAADGTRTVPATAGAALDSCSYDNAATLVCTAHDASGARLLALDADSGARLWQLPDAAAPGRSAPTVSAVWHGAVYGTTAQGPVVLDARTGAVRSTTPGLAPTLLDGDVGLSAPATGTPVTAYPAVG